MYDVNIVYFCFFFFNDTATTEIYTLSLHDALPISVNKELVAFINAAGGKAVGLSGKDARLIQADKLLRRKRDPATGAERSEEHTSELQSRQYLVCRLLLEKKKKQR